MDRSQITTHFKLTAKKNLKTEGRFQAYLQGAEDCYDYIKENEEKKVSVDWESKYNELKAKMDCITHSYTEKLQAKDEEIITLRNQESILKAKLEVIELIFVRK